MTALYALLALPLVAIAVAAWRPTALQALIERVAIVLVAPVAYVQQSLARAVGSLQRAIRHLAIFEGAPLAAAPIAEHHLGGIAMAGFFVLGVASEWLLVSMVLAGLFDASVALPKWLPSWATKPENAMACGLLCAFTAYGFPLLDIAGRSYVSDWGQAPLAFRRTIGIVCALGVLGCAVTCGLLGWMRTTIVATPIDAVSASAGVDGYARFVGVSIPVLLGVALILAAAIAMNVAKTAGLVVAVGLWLIFNVAMVALGLGSALMNAIHMALREAVTWSASLFRRDETTRSWFAPSPAAAGGPGSAAQPMTAGESGPVSDAAAWNRPPVAEAAPADATEEVASVLPQSRRGVEADDANWRAF